MRTPKNPKRAAKSVGALTLALFTAINSAGAEGADGAANVRALTPAEIGYSVDHWTVEDGLPGRIITSLAQTPDGALWCGGPDGLARFDGTRFINISPEQAPALYGVRILEMRSDLVGRLWIEGIDGALVVFERGQFRRLTQQDGLPANQGGKLGEVQDSVFWVKGRTDDQFYYYQDGRFKAVSYPGAPSSTIDRFLADAAGVRWGVHESDRSMVQILGSGTEVQRLAAPDGQSLVHAGRLFRLRDERWAVNSTYGIYVLDDSTWKLLHAYSRPLPDFHSNTVLDGVEDWSGNFWVSVFDLGLVVSGPDQPTTQVALPDSGPKPFMRAMLMGLEGNIWVGGNDGLYRLRRYPFQSQPPNHESQHQTVVGFIEDAHGAVWILRRDGWTRSTPQGWQSKRNPNPEAFLWAGCSSRDGSVVLGFTEHGNSDRAYADRVYPDGLTRRMGDLVGIIRVLLESKSGHWWVGTEFGLWHWDAERFVRVEFPQLTGEFAVRGLAEDRQGRVVASVYRDGLWRREVSGQWQRLTTPVDPASTEIWGIDIDPTDTIWAATDSGLARWRQGSWHSYAAQLGELSRLARSVTCDRQQGLWIASQFGVVRVDVEALNAVSRQKDSVLGSDWFDRSDGLPSVSCSDEQGALHLAVNGQVWVGTLKGAATIDPKQWLAWRRRVRPPAVAIDAVLADDHSLLRPNSLIGPDKPPKTLVRPGVQRVEFRYEVVDLTPNPKTRLRYRLDGFDREWRDAGEERRAAYHNLLPGNYSFQVMAANKYGKWTSRSASAPISVEPQYWQTTWFKVSAGIAVLGALWLTRLVTLRQTQRERLRRDEFSRGLIQSQETERKRIARELHDSLGQDLILIRNAAKLTLRKFNPPPTVSEHLNQVAELASHALTNARAITSNLRPPELDRLGLTSALEAMVEKNSIHSDVELAATIENVNGFWSADEEIHVYRLVQESLNNALKHANPRHIQLSVSAQNPEVIIVVQDDGCGFDRQQIVTQPTGIGLAGLRERVRILGGAMEINSFPGKGTTFRCRIPIPVYGQERDDSHSSRGRPSRFSQGDDSDH